MAEQKLQKISSVLETVDLGPARILPQMKEEGGKPFGIGVVEFKEASVPFDLTYNEILYCLEGKLIVRNADNEQTTLVQGETLFMAANQSITYEAPQFARLLYITNGNKTDS